MAMTYLLMLLLPFVFSALTDKENGRKLLLIFWSLGSIWYSIAYRYIAKNYECTTTKYHAFSINGGGTFHGVLYYLSNFILCMLVVLLIRVIFGM